MPTAILALGVAVGLLACGGSVTPTLGRRIPLIGFNDNSVLQRIATPERDAELLATLGANSARVTLNWPVFEPAPGRFDFTVSDQIYAALLARGVRPLWVPMFAPPWALPAGLCARTKDCHAPPLRRFDGEWSAFVTRIARRYPRSAGIEVWNEPNFAFFWRPHPDPVRYRELLSEAYRAVKAVAPSMPVVSAGVGLSTYAAGDVPMIPFMRTVLARGGAAYLDAFGLHTYTSGADEHPVALGLQAVRRLLAGAGARSRPIWITEAGATTTGSGAVSEPDQAALVSDLAQRADAAPDVAAFYVHTLLEPPFGAADQETGYGVLRGGGARKPAASVFERLSPQSRGGG